MTTRRQVLVVDDDDDQLQTLCRGLFYLGLACLPARTAGEALALLASPTGERIELLLVDLSAPGKPGAWLVDEARGARPELGVLVLTGLARSSEVIALGASGVRVLCKPFTPEQLGRAIHAAMSRDDEPKGQET